MPYSKHTLSSIYISIIVNKREENSVADRHYLLTKIKLKFK